jgi:hypothetical protein
MTTLAQRDVKMVKRARGNNGDGHDGDGFNAIRVGYCGRTGVKRDGSKGGVGDDEWKGERV